MTTNPLGIQELKPTAVIYLRVSTKDQAERGGGAEGFSIPAQREACMRKAESLGATVVAEFIDAGESARSANRPELQRMLQFIGLARVPFVIVHKVDRLARNRVDDVEINMQLTAAGSKLVSCSENIDETPSGMLLHGIMSSIAEFYSRNLATESKKGMQQKAKTGGTPGQAPFGYLNVRERTAEGREIRTVALDPERAKWVSWLYEMYATGEWTTAMLRDELTQRGVTTRPRPNRVGLPIANSHVNNILTNRYYIGYVKYDGVEYPGTHQKLITEEAFDAAQKVRTARAQSGEKPRVRSHYLKGSVFCGSCGEPLMFAQSRNRVGDLYDYFVCLGRQSKNGCLFRATPIELVEDLVADHWASVTLPEDDAREVRAIVLEHIQKEMPRQGAARRKAEERIEQLDRRAKKLLEAHYADAITVGQLKEEQREMSVQRAEAERTLALASENDEVLVTSLDRACTLLENAQNQYLAGDQFIKRELNQSVFRHIYIEDDEIVGSDLTAAFERLTAGSLRGDLERERKRVPARAASAGPLTLVPRTAEPRSEHGVDSLRPQAPRSARTAPGARDRGHGVRARPRGPLPWERKNPGPFQDRGSNESLLVAGAGFEPATSGL